MLRIPIEIESIQVRLDGVNIDNLDIKEAIRRYELHLEDESAHEINCYFLSRMDEYIPYRIVNIMISRIYQSRSRGLSRYAEIKDCEDFLIKTDWFKGLKLWKQHYIQEDFSHRLLLIIFNAHHRKKQWRSIKR